MPKPSSDNLFRLIKSLTKDEKRGFNLHVQKYAGNEGGLHLQLFGAVEKQKEHDEGSIKEIHSFKHFETLKSRLYTEVLDFLSYHHRGSKAQFHVQNLISQADILVSRSLYKQADELLRKAQKIAIKYSLDSFVVIILQKRYYYILHNTAKNKLRVTLNASAAEINAAILNQLQIMQNRKTSSELYFHSQYPDLFSDRSSQKALAATIRRMEGMSAGGSFFQQVHLYEPLCLYYYGKEIYQKAFVYSKKILNLCLANKQFIYENSSDFISYVHNHLEICVKLKRKADFLETYKLVVGQKFSDPRLDQQFALEINSTLLEFYIVFEQLQDAVVKVNEIQKQIRVKPNRQLAPNQLELFFKCGFVFFLKGDYVNAKAWMNGILKEKQLLTEPMYLIIRTLLLICSFELKDFIDFERNYPLTRRAIKNSSGFEVEINIIDVLNTALHKQSDTKSVFIKALSKIEALEKTTSKNSFIGSYYNLESWLRKKNIQK